MNLAALRQKRASKLESLQAIETRAANENGRDLTEAETAEFDAGMAEVRSLEAQIVRAEFLADAERRAPAARIEGERRAGDLTTYSLAKALQESVTGKLTGLEAEAHQELSRGREVRGLMVPASVLMQTRALKTTTPGAGPGSNLIGRDQMPLTEHPRPALLVEAQGATVMRDLVGNVDLPHMPESGQVGWVAEHTNVTRTDPKFSKSSLTPRTVGGEYEISRRMLLQSATSLEDLLRRDLGLLIRGAVDRAAVAGKGGVEPMGIINTAGVVTIPFTGDVADTTADMIAALDMDDLTGSRGFLANTGVMQFARKVKDGDGHVIPMADLFHGERLAASTNLPGDFGAAAGPPVVAGKPLLIYGQWSELVVGYWSGVDILVNPYHVDVASKGGVLIHAFLDCDVAVRTPEAFVVAGIG